MTIDATKLETRLFINNEFVNSSSGKTFATINPATEEVICIVQEASLDDVNRAVRAERTKDALLYLKNRSFTFRCFVKKERCFMSHTILTTIIDRLNASCHFLRGG